jgi:Ran GTPase-activating protein (RanGAP) involved in mRNA processing and transport
MGALTSLNLSKNGMQGAEAGKALGDALATNTVLKELDLSGQPETSICYAKPNMDVAFVKVFAPGLSDNGAISSINLLKNQIPVEQAQELVKIMRPKENLTTLCGLGREETELDFSGQGLKAGDAVLIANDIRDMRALVKLDISSNDIGGEQEGGLQRVCVASGIELDK